MTVDDRVPNLTEEDVEMLMKYLYSPAGKHIYTTTSHHLPSYTQFVAEYRKRLEEELPDEAKES
jgi:hypothetical protein